MKLFRKILFWCHLTAGVVAGLEIGFIFILIASLLLQTAIPSAQSLEALARANNREEM